MAIRIPTIAAEPKKRVKVQFEILIQYNLLQGFEAFLNNQIFTFLQGFEMRQGIVGDLEKSALLTISIH
jgi:hypothetical protein